MAIAYSSAGAGSGTETDTVALDLACPATVNANDILIAHVIVLNTTQTPDTPSGWSLLYGPAMLGDPTATGQAWVFGKLADGSEDGATISFGVSTGTSGRYGRIYSFTGYSSGTLADVVPEASFSSYETETDPAMPTVVTTQAGALAVALIAQDDDNSHASTGAVTGGSWTEAVADFVSTTLGANGCCCQIQTCTPTADPGMVTGGIAAGNDDEGSTIGFEIRPDPGTANPSPYIIGQHTALTINTSGALAPTIPTHAANDILFATIGVWVPSTASAINDIPTPANWTKLGSVDWNGATKDGQAAWFWRRASGSGTTVSFSRGSGWDTGTDSAFFGQVDVIRGCETSGDPYDDFASAGEYSAANANTPAVTVSGSKRLVLIAGAHCVDSAAAQFTALTGFAMGGQRGATTGTGGGARFAWIPNQSSSHSATATTHTASSGTSRWYALGGISFKPPADAAATIPDLVMAPLRGY